MHQTTLRFPQDLWRFLEQEAADLGVSVAQYVREAALARAAYDAGRRGDSLFIDQGVLPAAAGVPGQPPPTPELTVSGAIAGARETVTDSSAVWAQARLVRRRSEVLREQTEAYKRDRAARA